MTELAQTDVSRPSALHLAEAVGRISRNLCSLTHDAGLYRLACLLREVEIEAQYALEIEQELTVN